MPEKEAFNNLDECKKNIKYASHEIKTVYPTIFYEKELQKLQINEYNSTELKVKSQEVVDEKLNSEVYKYFYKDTIESTLHYLFYKISNGIYIEIKDNKVNKFLPFNNLNFRNDWHNIIKLKDKYSSTKDYFNEKNKIYPLKNQNKYSVYDKAEWAATDCLIFTERGRGTPYINDTYWVQLKNLLEETCKNRKVPDIVFFLNKKDLPFLKDNRTHPFESIVGKNHRLDIGKYYYFSPILSQSTRDGYADIPIPSSDEWEYITQNYFINNCNSKYVKEEEPKWEDKINTAFFRGSATGCKINLENPRLHITKINNDWKTNSNYNEKNNIDGIPFLDAGIIRFSTRNRAVDGVLKFQNAKELKNKGVKPVNYVDHEQQAKYKYIIYIEGNSAAYRLSYLLNRNSLVMKVNSKYKLWFEHLLVPYEHYVPIKEDLSDLGEIIKWCKLNDKLCKDIVKNANIFCKKYFDKEYIFDYMQNIFMKIGNRQFSYKENNFQFKKYKENRKIINRDNISVEWKDTDKKIKTAIIVPYRDNKLQDRKKHLDSFVKFWKSKNNLLKGYTYKIFIAEQSDDNRKFNRGQLCNLGFLVAEKEGFNNFIFHDVDLLPSDDLLPYYFYNSNLPIHIGIRGYKYTHYTYFGGVTGFSLVLLRKINGHPNQLWGWGGEDDIIYNRYALMNNSSNMLIPDKGSLTELYHVESETIKSLKMYSGLKKKLIIEDIEDIYKDGISHLKLKDDLKIENIDSDLIVKYKFQLTIK